jgi:hypothetical protein
MGQRQGRTATRSKRTDSFTKSGWRDSHMIGRPLDAAGRHLSDCIHRLGKRRTRLDLDDRDQIAAPRDQVDLAKSGAVKLRATMR